MNDKVKLKTFSVNEIIMQELIYALDERMNFIYFKKQLKLF